MSKLGPVVSEVFPLVADVVVSEVVLPSPSESRVLVLEVFPRAPSESCVAVSELGSPIAGPR
mgnify:CR=1 FL=1